MKGSPTEGLFFYIKQISIRGGLQATALVDVYNEQTNARVAENRRVQLVRSNRTTPHWRDRDGRLYFYHPALVGQVIN